MIDRVDVDIFIVIRRVLNLGILSIFLALFIVEVSRQSRHVDDNNFSVLFLIVRLDFQHAIRTIHHDQLGNLPSLVAVDDDDVVSFEWSD